MHFDTDFLWGLATSSYQVEGAAQVDGRGVSIWDTFCRTPGKVYANHNGDVACDQYHRYASDVALMSDIDIRAYRFSIAWPRILPTGSGAVNRKGIDYYRRLAEKLREHAIIPVATLYHWDLPQVLQDAGGWPSRETALRFGDYAEICFRELGDCITHWITINEPWCVAVLGHLQGHHAPGHTSVAETVATIHHLNMAHGIAVSALRATASGEIGTALNCGVVRPATRREADIEAADQSNDETRMYLWPLFGKGYPQRRVEALERAGAPIPLQDGDLEQIAQPIDFVGLNYYMEFNTKQADTPDEPFNQQPQWERQTAMGWHITPRGIYRHLQWLRAEIGDIPLYITENGCAVDDRLTADGKVHDHERIAFLRAHLHACSDAIADGINLRGYFLWSLIDNLEWGFGYTKRFGIVYCDYQTLARYPKDSYYFYRDVIAGYIE